MATSDLLAELSKDTFRAAPGVERQVCDAVLKQLDDQSGDVSSLAVRCLPPLLRGASDAASAKVVEALCAKLASAGKDAGALRDVGVVGLKTILSEIARPDAARRVVSVAAPKLAALVASAVRSGDAAKDTGMAGDVSGDCIDILHLASSCHGDAMRPLADAVAGTLLEYVASGGRAGGRKKASACLAALGAATGDDALLDRVADAAMENLTPEAMGVKSDADVAEMSARSADAAAEYVALLGAAARASRGRFAKRAALAFPRLKALLTNCASEATEGLRERCLATLETFAGACAGASAEVRDELWAAETIRVALELCAYDPNVDADPIDPEEDSDAEDESRGGGDVSNNSGGESEDGGYSDYSDYSDEEEDADDASWKIRRGAAGLAGAIFANPGARRGGEVTDAGELRRLAEAFARTAKTLASRLVREQDESVRLDAFASLEGVFRASADAEGALGDALRDAARAAAPIAARRAARASEATDKTTSAKTRKAAFATLRAVSEAVPGCLAAKANANRSNSNALLASLAPAVVRAIEGAKEPATRVEALAFLRAALGDEANADAAKAVAAQDEGRALESLVNAAAKAANEPYYKVAAEALRVGAASASAVALVPDEKRRVALADALAKTALERVSANDQDQEVKEAAIAAAGATLAALADAIDDDSLAEESESKTSAALVRALLERRGDAATRERAADALAAALQRAGPALDATLFDPASGLATLALAKLVAHFRDAREDRALKAAGLDAVAALFERRSASALDAADSSVADEDAADAVAAAARLIVDLDVALAAKALGVVAAIARSRTREEPAKNGKGNASARARLAFERAAATALETAAPAANRLAASPLAERRALAALRGFFAALAGTGVTGASPKELVLTLVGCKGEADAHAADVAAGECAAAACDACDETQRADLVATLTDVAKITREGVCAEKARRALCVLGALGKGASKPLDEKAAAGLEDVISKAFDDAQSEETRRAAAVALGGVAAGAGNRARFFPIVLAGVADESAGAQRQYAHLVALREVVEATGVGSSSTGDDLDHGAGDVAGDVAGGGETFSSSLFFSNADAGAPPLSAADAAAAAAASAAAANASDEEGLRAVAAECVGRLASRDASGDAIRALAAVATSEASGGDASANARVAAVTAARFALALARGEAEVRAVADALPAFVGAKTMTDPDAAVRRAAVRTLSAAAHARGAAFLAGNGVLEAALEPLLAQTAILPELIRVVDLGPFKHTVDDGLDLRKAAFECLDTLLERREGRGFVDDAVARRAPGVVAAAVSGLGDAYDVKMTAHRVVEALATRGAATREALAARLGDVAEPMRKTLAAKLKSDAVKQEMDRAEDLKRSCLRAMSAVAIEVAGAAEHEAFRKVVEGTIEPSETLRGMYEKALEEAGGAARGRA